jgi:hypothetical protein
MRHKRPVTQAAISLAVWPLTVIFSPVILVAGEPVNRYVMRRVRRSAAAGPATVTGHGGRPARAVAARPPGMGAAADDAGAPVSPDRLPAVHVRALPDGPPVFEWYEPLKASAACST